MNFFNPDVERKLRVLIVSLFFLYIFAAFIKPILDSDTPWHLKTGEYIVLNKKVPTSDPFSFANDKIPFIGKFILTQYWLSQIFFFQIYKICGPFGLVITGALTFTSIIILLWFLIKDKGFYISLFVTGGFAFNTLKDFLSIRPQIFTFLFTAIVIFLMEKYKKKKSAYYILPLPFLMVLWANMHGGFIYGIIIIAFYTISEVIKFCKPSKLPDSGDERLSSKQCYQLILLCVISVLFSLVNPNTYKAFLYVFITHSKDLFANIQEYQTPYAITKSNPSKMIYSFWLYLFVSLIMMVIFIKRRDFSPFFLLLFSAIPPLISIRYIPLFSIVATSTFGYIPIRTRPETSFKWRYGIGVLILAIFLFSLLIFSSNPFKDENIYKFKDSASYPVTATDFLIRNEISGNIFCSYNKSAFILFRLFPASRVYSDSRFISEKRIKKSLKISGEFDSAEERFENINRLLPKNIGTISISVGEKNIHNNILKEQDNTTYNRSWKDLLDDINAEIIIHEAVNLYTGNIYPIIFKLVREDMWKLIYADGNVLIFVKDIQKFREVITRYNEPKSLIYDEIVMEGLRGVDQKISGYYSSVALALLLKGVANSDTNYFIENALSIDSRNITAHYCKALHVLMNQKKIT